MNVLYKKSNGDSTVSRGYCVHKDVVVSNLIGLAVFSTFLPFKIYPFFYLIACISLVGAIRNKVYLYNIFLFLFCFVSGVVFLLHPIDDDTVSALIKLYLNAILIFFLSISERKTSESLSSLKIIELYLRLIMLLCFIQVLVLQLISGGISITAGDSYSAGQIFESGFALFGGVDKNMFGAKVALFGYLHYVLYYMVYRKYHFLYAGLTIFTALLSLSRTSFIFVIIAIFFFYFLKKDRPFAKVFFALTTIIIIFFAMPYILDYVRISSITSFERNDGMSIRLLYWISVFKEYDEIGFMGQGILSARQFLPRFSEYYNGEPNVHNLFLNTYLDIGVLGFFLYFSFFISLFFNMRKKDGKLTLILFLPLLLMINTLYTAYDSEPWAYYILSILIIRSKQLVSSLEK
ncbi:O-antigen ligase family protein [Pectobacterium odoriferum]|uniref:O-antigen ligase family protein n=1 Tax=Pectobacterium odoriferum TaxID=78398 RepID=UPI000CD2A074|nr:O-antigen ligase family protein [Pectobacterium odoriferum]POE03305.1 hypothetical protein BVY05_05435 [Pectobacterium odoriferum]